MTDSADAPSFLDELDARQDEILRQLDDLNARLEKLLAEQTAAAGAGPQSADKAA